MFSDTDNLNDKILVVDDNKTNLALIKSVLKNEGVEVSTAESGEEAIKVLQEGKFSLIIMDVSMPFLSGFETVKIIQDSQISNDTPIMFISSEYKAETYIEEGFKAGAHDYILRPIDITLFRNKVQVLLKLYRTEQQLKKANLLLAEKANHLDKKLTEQLQINEELKFSEQIFENSVNGIIVVDENLQFVHVNKAFTEMTGYSIAELIGKTPKILTSGIQSKEFYEEMWQTLVMTGSWQGELWNRKKDNELYAEMLSINAVRNADGHVSNYIGIISDITQKKLSHEKTERLANYDHLTGLPNRRNLMAAIQNRILNPEVKNMAVIFLDLDKFKPVNDNYGHQVGDDLLIAVAKRLRASVRDGDFVGRLGGDEFVILLEDPIMPQEAAIRVAEKVIKAISSPFNISNQQLNINTSIGISLYPEHSDNPDELITLADNAMYKSKDDGTGCFSFCTD